MGTTLQQGKYTVNAVLGQGGFGITYLATDTALRRRVAIKELFPQGCVRQGASVLLPAPHAPLSARAFDRVKEWFVKEAQTLAQFDYSGIVRVYTEFKENNTAYMVMEYLHGRTLADVLLADRETLPEPEAVRHAMAIGRALEKMHEVSVLHRDVKPQNVIVTDDGRTVLVDFGAARGVTAAVTETITVMLTEGYAPPEQYSSSARAGPYTDVYGLGATLYSLLTGKVPPVPAPARCSGTALMPPDRLNAQVSERVSKAVMKSMEIDAADRYQSMDEFLDALANHEPVRPPPPAAGTSTRGDRSVRRDGLLRRGVAPFAPDPVPGKPKIVDIANPNAGTSATLMFERPRRVTDDQIAGYDVQKRLSSRMWSEAPAPIRVASKQTQYTFTGLARQSTYVFRVRAYNDRGNGAWSDDSPEQFIPAAPIKRQPVRKPPPPPPTGPTLTRVDGAGRATWANVRGATGYDLRWRQRGAWTHVADVVSPCTIAPLVNSEILHVQVRAKNGTGASAWSPTAWSDGTPDIPRRGMTKRFVLGVALLAVIIMVLRLIGLTATPRDDNDSTAPRKDGGATPTDESAVTPIYPRISSLVRRDPSELRTNADSVTWRITFSEQVRNVDAADFFVIGMGPSRNLNVAKANGLGRVYDITLDGDALEDHNDAVTLRLSSRNDIKDVDGNGVVNLERTGSHSATFVIDNTAPRVADIVGLSRSGERANADVIWRVTFTEPVQNVSVDDFRVGGVIGEVNASVVLEQEGSSRARYRVTASGGDRSGIGGNVTLVFNANQDIRDDAGNALTDTKTVTPIGENDGATTVTIAPASGRIDNAVRNLTLTFSGAVYRDSGGAPFTKLTLGELIDLRKNDESGDKIAFTASIDEDYDMVTIDPIGKLPVRTWLRVNDTYYDSLGHRGREETATFILEATRTLDTTPPTVKIDGVPATDSGGFMATFAFSEPVTGFTESDVRVANATASAFTEVKAGRRWHVRITPTGDNGLGDGAIPDSIEVSRYGVWLPADQVTDLAGNGNTESTRHAGSYGRDVTDPRLLSIVRKTPSTSPAQADSITWRVTFSEDVRHFTTSSVNLLEDQSDRVIRLSADRVSAAGPSESAYDVTFGGLENYSGRVRLNFHVRSDDDSYSAYIQDKTARSLLCCETLGTDERTFDLDNAPAAMGAASSGG